MNGVEFTGLAHPYSVTCSFKATILKPSLMNLSMIAPACPFFHRIRLDHCKRTVAHIVQFLFWPQRYRT